MWIKSSVIIKPVVANSNFFFKGSRRVFFTFLICGNVYDHLDYETHATDRLKLCVIYKYGNIGLTYKAQ